MPGPARRPVGSDDRGFSLLEVVVSIAIISIVMAASAVFLTGTVRASHHQGDSQAGARVLAGAIDQVRALQGSALVSGRSPSLSAAQWATPQPGVRSNLGSIAPASDPTATGNAPLLPFDGSPVVVDNTAYTPHWYVGSCWQPPAGGACLASPLSGYVPLYRVVVAVTWADVSCPNALCSSVGVTLVDGSSTDPIFNAGDTPQPPTVVSPGPQVSDVGWPVSLRVAANGGGPPLTYTQTGLPPGLSLTGGDNTGVTISGTPTTPVTLAAVTLVVTDGFGHTGTALFNWAVNPAPTISPVASQTSTAGTPATLAFTVTGGSAPFSWTVSGLPAGLTADPATGAVRGTPTTAGTTTVTARLVDRAGAPASVTFSWTVNPQLTAVGPGNQASTVGRPAALNLSANYGTPPYVWVVTGLPAGLTLNPATGAISGTPTTAGTSAVTATVTDSRGGTASTSFSWVVKPPPTLVQPSAQTATAGTPDSLTYSVSGGTAPLRWSETGLPVGLGYDTTTGAVTGTPTTAGISTVTVTVTDANGATTTRTFTWTVNSQLVLTNPGTVTSTAGQSVNRTLAVTGGTAPLAFSATGLPPGLTINAGSGAITGSPSSAGSSTVVETVTDSAGASSTVTFTWNVNGPLALTNPGGQASTATRPVTLTLARAGGTGSASFAATGLPTGLTITSAGVISGTPTTAGTYTVTATVTDSVGATSSATFTWLVNPVPTVLSPGPQAGTVNRPMTFTLTSTGGTGAVTWSATGLPAGLSLASGTGVVSGTPTTAGVYSSVVTVTDSLGGSSFLTVMITINPNPVVTDPGPQASTVNRPATLTLTSTAGTAPVTWAATGLPPGLTLNSGSGLISGTPTVTGTYSVTATVTDARGATATQIFTWTVNGAPVVTDPGPQTSTVNRPATTVTLTATGGTGTRTFTATGLPVGLSITPGGVISGTPTTAGISSVTVTVTDAQGATGTRTFGWTVNAAPIITDPGPRSSTVNRPSSLALGVTGGTAPFTWAATGLPAGLTIDPATGVISGTPSAVGTSSVTVTVTDAFGATDPQAIVWTVNTVPTVNNPGTQNSTTTTPVSLTLTSTGGTAPVTWAVTNLPPGLTLNPTSGLITGTPTTAGSYSTVATVTDASGATASATFTWSVVVAGVPVVVTGPVGPINTVLGAPISPVTATATGGTGAKTFSATGLPAGVTITSGGLISGTPTVAGTTTATITATDSVGVAASRPVVFRVLGIISPATGSTVTSPGSVTSSVTPVTAGNVGTLSYTYTASFSLTFYLTFNASTGQLTLTPVFGPVTRGNWPFTLTVRDATTGLSYTTSFTWTIT